MNINIILCILFILIICTYYINNFLNVKEGINFSKDYFLDKYEKDGITIDKLNFILEKDGKKFNYKKINNYNKKYKYVNDKFKLKEIYKRNSIPVPNYYKWDPTTSSEENIININKNIIFPLVVKPIIGEKGYGVKTDITNNDELINHVSELLSSNNDVLIEQQVTGKEYRIMVLNDVIIGITQKIPPFIIGDNIHSISELINILNNTKEREHRIHIPDISYIKKQGFNMSSILPIGKKIVITNVANMSNGSSLEYIDINKVHIDNISLFKKINNVLGLKLSGIDYICDNLQTPYYMNGYVIEVNSRPGFGIHYNITPDSKKEKLLDSLLNILF